MASVVDAFTWPLRLLGLTPPAKEGDLDHVPLLSIPSNCIVNHLVPALTPQERGTLALTCTAMSQLLAGTVTQLSFDGPQMCFAAKSPRLLQLSNVRRMHLTLRGWHDIGCSAPRLLLHLSLGLPHVEDVVLLDQTAEDDYEPLGSPSSAAAAAASYAASLWPGGGGGETAHCDGCGYEMERPDLSCVLISCLALFPKLKQLEIYTKLLSDAELAAVGRFQELTSLTLNSEIGVMPGALCSLSSLTRLRELRLGDVDGNNPQDVETLCAMVSQLTSLHMGYCPHLQAPVLRRLRQLHAAVQHYRSEQAAQAEEQRRAAAAGRISKTAKAAASLVASVASAVLPGVGGSSSSNSPPEPPMSHQLLRQAGVRIDDQQAEAGGYSGNSAAAARAASESVSAHLPGGTRRSRGSADPPHSLDTHYHDPGTVASQQAVQHPEALRVSAQQQRRDNAPAGPANSATDTAQQSSTGHAGEPNSGPDSYSGPNGPPVVLGSGSTASSGNSNLSALQIVTELSVNIDAEDGDEILKEMSQLALLQSLMVDSTDEFKIDPGFQPFNHTTDLKRLAITMPMSLANTQSLSKCRKLRELLLCTLPEQLLGQGSLDQVTRLELLDVSVNRPDPKLLQAFPAVTHLIIRRGADDTTISMIGHNLSNLKHLECYNLPVGYSRSGLKGLAHLQSLQSLVLEVAAPFTSLNKGGHSSSWGPGMVAGTAGLIGEVVGDISALAGNIGVPLVGINAVAAFSPPAELNWAGLSRSAKETSSSWFPQLRELHLLGYVAATDADLPALLSLTHLQSLKLHLQKPDRGFAGRVTLRGLWNLAQQSRQLAEIHLTGAMQTLLLVPGRLPGVGL